MTCGEPDFNPPSEHPTGDAPSTEMETPFTPPAFCPDCGVAWDPSWRECVPCAERRSRCVPDTGDADKRALRSALGLYFVLLASMGLAFLWRGDAGRAELAVTIVDSVIVLLWVAFGSRETLASLTRWAGWQWCLLAATLSLVTFGLSIVLVGGLTAWLSLERVSYSACFLDDGFGWGMIVLVICVQPAIIEELAFRGVIQGALGRILSPRDAIVVTALLFMTLHLTLLSFPFLFVMGLVLGVLRARLGSLYPGMVLHFCHNGIVLLLEAQAK